MGKVTWKRYYGEFKTKVALEAIEGMTATFADKASEPKATASGADVEKLHAKIGQLVVERDFLRDASVRLGLIRGAK